MSRLSDLLDQLKLENPRLGADLQAELSNHNQRTFGLVFERHLPENVELPGRPVRRGDTVRIFPPRGSKDTPDTRLWRVESLRKNDQLRRVARLMEIHPKKDTDSELLDSVSVDDLVVVAQHNDTIYPGLRQTGEVIGSEDPDAPFHSVINAENYHALKMLTYTHYHSIDCIYIDPPYNTGAKDWKYNNDYVDGDDGYRHSKWLSFMERRLLIAKQLLNPDDSVLIVTIDEKEYLRLGMLLEQTFPEATIQMVSIVMSSFGSPRMQAMDRVDEYAFFVYLGSASPARVADDMLSEKSGSGRNKPVRWENLLRSGSNFKRTDRPNLFYPIFVSKSTGRIVSTGPSKPATADKSEWELPDGSFAIWPTRRDGSEGRWQVGQDMLSELLREGVAYLGGTNEKKGTGSVYYLTKSQRQALAKGGLVVVGRRDDGSLIVEHDKAGKLTTGKSVWNRRSHAANLYGTQLVKSLLAGRAFPYPKSLYAVEDAIRFAVKDKPDATILDFFSGSGTTAHAVMRLNKQDGGRRRSISVTNNEVSANEQEKLSKQGLRPGDPEWEKWGICDYVTKPRVEAAITGRTPEDDPIKGDYKFTDEFPMSDGFEANARFFTLTYQPPTRVRHGYAFAEISPMLWMRAGQIGRIIESIPERGWDIAESYAIIENVAASATFAEELSKHTGINVIYIVTNDDLVFESMARELSNHDAELVRLYSTYLNNFAFQQNRETM